MKKVIFVIGLMALSVGAFAQTLVSTQVYFESMPANPLGLYQDVMVKCTYYNASNVQIDEAFGSASFMAAGGTVIVYFPSNNPVLIAQVAYTRVDLYFYNHYTGVGKSFSGIPAFLVCPDSFAGENWWFTKNKDIQD